MPIVDGLGVLIALVVAVVAFFSRRKKKNDTLND
jgi:LPXTG-motif cell wall-anchored protein